MLAMALLWPLATTVFARGAESAESSGTPATLPIGYDVSYPQCGDALPELGAFAIVGVNGGRVYASNPCLGDGDRPSQLAWGGELVQLYANTANPGPRLSDYWPIGQTSPQPCTADDPDSEACAYDYGWNAAADSYARAVSAFVSLGLAEPDATRTPVPAAWWLDVETANSWRADAARNVAALRGAVDYLESVDVASVGFYSAPRMWAAITGGTDAFADHPSWVAGATTLSKALDVCRGDGLTGGPVAMAQFSRGGLDTNVACGTQ
jgi:hypothetical protein